MNSLSTCSRTDRIYFKRSLEGFISRTIGSCCFLKIGFYILTTDLYFVEEQTGSFNFIPRSGVIKQLISIKCSPLSPLTDNPTVKGYVNSEM